jgi:dihydrofolate synthase/folylpolyglutamate synthase
MQLSTAIRSHRDALAYLFGRIDYERTLKIPYRSRTFKLDRMRDLLARLGNPENSLKIVHVAGTKGKGSTSSMLAGALTAADYRTGLYTSPHLDRLEERLMIDGEMCSADELVDLVRRVQPVVTELDHESSAEAGEAGPTYFEITTAMALLHFAGREVDTAVLEVGLGGRLDSTNVCHPLVSVITSISFDHVRQLGNTLTAIAGEKAGILKPGVPVVSGVLNEEPREVIRQRAKELGCPLRQLGEDFDFTYRSPNVVDFRSWGDTRRHLRDAEVGLIGRHQAANAAVALAALEVLAVNDWNVPDDSARHGLANVVCPARVECLSRKPTIIVDAAHNAASVEALVEVLLEFESTIPDNSDQSQRTLVFATSLDKDTNAMLRSLLPRFDRVIFTRYMNNPRAVDPNELLATAKALVAEGNAMSPKFAVFDDSQAAASQAQAQLGENDLLCVTGSFFIAAEMRTLLRDS